MDRANSTTETSSKESSEDAEIRKQIEKAFDERYPTVVGPDEPAFTDKPRA